MDDGGKVILVYEDFLHQTHILEGGAQLEDAVVILGLEPVDEDLRFPHLLLQGGAGQLVHHWVCVSGVEPKKQAVLEHGNFIFVIFI